MKNRWAKIGRFWYHFDENGTMATGWKTIGGVNYYFSETEKGDLETGACQIGDEGPAGYTEPTTGDTVPSAPSGQQTASAGPSGPDQSGTPAAPAVQTPALPYNGTFIDVDITNQCVNVYVNGEVVVTGPCVTGFAGVHDTTVGEWTIQSKETSRYLQGTNDNGTRYKSYVNFWMPFHNGEGLHDASWRSAFGGEIYKTNGSHGCVNMPYEVAAAMFHVAYVGMPVHVHR